MKLICYVLFLLTAHASSAQKLSVDIAGIRNQAQEINGINASFFYHFTEVFSAGIEVNRFFKHGSVKNGNKIYSSAWDYDFNIHYYLPLHQKLYIYPLAGVSYASEKEYAEETKTEKHLYANAGVGLLLNIQKLKPHIEYVSSFSSKAEHFLIAGITLEINLKKEKN
jgi:hypothetical protein